MNWSIGSTGRWCRAPRPNSSPPSLPSARNGTAAPDSPLSGRTQRQGRQGRDLRDLHTLFWIAKYVYACARPTSCWNAACSTRRNTAPSAAAPISCGRFRCNIHFFSGRAEERLSFDMQREIAVRLGYTSHPGMQDVERFMKHYFLVAKEVGDLTAILCAKLEDQQAKPAPVLSRMMARLRPSTNRRRVADSDDFIIDKQPHQSRSARYLPA